ncbi:MAG: 4-(cytidine 5'-diphospho)-2-C-methyl-D-erythritol kinase [Deltaproteobacteria bacterium]|nr:4-(cytidine 5'-diphospho)-2-C-methyl-D-erythritol kinase [Deltaproteobacteria bacterium]
MNLFNSFFSPAKVNLFLRVFNKRPDGYHEISSLMQPISLYDEISIVVKDGEGVSISCADSRVPDDSTNLAAMAAQAILDATGVRKRIVIAIRKHIPVGAGLGGGSSNAAAVLMALNGMLEAGFDDAALMNMGAKLGSDVPFFILKSAAIARGRGEELEKVEPPDYRYILINPGFEVSTAWAYRNFDLTNAKEDNTLLYSKKPFDGLDDAAVRGLLVNDLESITIKRYPEIARLKERLLEAGAIGALMSGSGPTVFGVFRDRQDALGAYERIRGSIARECFVTLADGL